MVYMKVNRYHSFLRISILVSAFALIFDSGILFPVTKQFSDNTISYVAGTAGSVGMFASVPQNELNTLSAQIAEQQKMLDAREATLRAREISARGYDSGGSIDYSTYIISVVLFILTVLLVLNYVMDWVRIRRFAYEKSMG